MNKFFMALILIIIIAICWLIGSVLHDYSKTLYYIAIVICIVIAIVAKRKLKNDDDLLTYQIEQKRKSITNHKFESPISWSNLNSINSICRDNTIEECLRLESLNWNLSPLETLLGISNKIKGLPEVQAGFYFCVNAYLNYYVLNSTSAAIMNAKMCMDLLDITCKQDIIMPFYMWMAEDKEFSKLVFDSNGIRI